MFVPLRAGTDIVFLGGIINHVITTGSDFREYVLHYTNAPTIIREEFEDAGADGLFSGWDPDRRGYDPTSWQYEDAFVAAAAGQRDQEGNLASQGPGGEGQRRGDARGTPELDLTLEHPRCVWQILKRHYAALHAGDGGAGLRRPPGRVRQGLRAVREPTPGASAPPRSCTASAGRSTRSARSTSAPRRSCSCCWATWGARAVA